MVYNSGFFKMKKCLFVLTALLMIAFSSCQKPAGNPVSKDFSIEGTYTELEVSHAFNVTVSDAASQITVTVGENVMPYVVVEKVDNTLKIYCKPMNITVGEMKVVLPYNADLTSVDLSGASEFRSEYGLGGQKVEVELSGASGFYSDIVADEIDLGASGASNIKGNVTATELDLELSGASDATLMGEVDKLDMELSGNSSIKKTVVNGAYGLVCGDCSGLMSGASEAYIHCDGRICVDLSGASTLHYTGDGSSSGCSNTTGGSTISGPEHP